jgi:hypothetical protein
MDGSGTQSLSYSAFDFKTLLFLSEEVLISVSQLPF